MCGQWSEEGYIRTSEERPKQGMLLADWKRLIDELSAHQVSSVLLRGGEPFLFPGIIELLEYINFKGIFTAIDTNATMLKDYATDILRIGKIHITISVDGPEAIHDTVRGVKGCFRRIKEGVDLLNELEKGSEHKISRSICFTISPYSIAGLGQMPGVARSLDIHTISINPYYYFPERIGKAYEQEIMELSGCPAFSWKGFHHESSGVDFNEFQQQYAEYLDTLDGIYNYPYMSFSEADYRTWFNDPLTTVGSTACTNVEKLIDIQPDGNANFCVDFPDYSIGNVKEATIEELWNSERADRFRQYRRKTPLAICYRCGSKYMSEIVE
jgi:MoaA/NifB/PqqE/SkfB family radical SAM enzyme